MAASVTPAVLAGRAGEWSIGQRVASSGGLSSGNPPIPAMKGAAMKDVVSLPRFMPGHRRASHRRFEGSEGPARKGDCDRVASSELLDGVERLRFDTPLMEPDVQICRAAQLLLAFTPPGRTEAQTGLLRRMPTSLDPIIRYGGFSPIRLEGGSFRRGFPSVWQLRLLPACVASRSICVRPLCIPG